MASVLVLPVPAEVAPVCLLVLVWPLASAVVVVAAAALSCLGFLRGGFHPGWRYHLECRCLVGLGFRLRGWRR